MVGPIQERLLSSLGFISFSIPHGVILETNEVFEDMLGLDSGQLVGSTLRRLCPSIGGCQAVCDRLLNPSRYQSSLESTLCLCHADGSVVRVNVHPYSLPNDEGSDSSIMCLFVSPVSQAGSHTVPRHFVNAIAGLTGFPDTYCLYAITLDGVITYLSAGFSKLYLGLQPEDVLGLNWIVDMPPLGIQWDMSTVDAAMSKVSVLADSRDGHDAQVLEYVDPDGERHYIKDSAHYYADGENEFLCGIMEDVTELRTRTEDLIKAKKDAERARDAKSDFLAQMSHELRTPLNAIIGYSDLLRAEEGIPPDSLEMVEQMSAASNMLKSQINKLLDMRSLELGKFDANLEPTCVPQLVENCIATTNSSAVKRDIVIEKCWSKEDVEKCCAMADKSLLNGAVLNLLSNAIKYSNANTTIAVNITIEDEHVRIEIIDHGDGLSEGELSIVFEPFERVESHSSKLELEGSGLGLFLTRQFVALMNGEVGLDSKVGVGTTAWLKIPRASSSLSHTHTCTAPVDSQIPNRSRVRKDAKVLYIEDNAFNRALMRRMFTKIYGLEIVCASSGKEGIEASKCESFDLVMVDLNMPGMDGFKVLRVLREDMRVTSHIVAVSAYASQDDVDSAIDAGFESYLTKPLSIASLVDMVGPYLNV